MNTETNGAPEPDWLNRCHIGDCRTLLRQMATACVRVQMCVTSPPYYGLRDYGHEGQIGLEPSLWDWLDTMVEVFRLARDVLSDDGTLWLNLGDSYASTGGAGWQGKNGQRADRRFTACRNTVAMRAANRSPPAGLKAKDLMGQPWRLAFALQADGWYLRQDIVWAKRNPMPESVKDRFTKSHEYLFLLAKSERYYFDRDAVKEPSSPATRAHEWPSGWESGPDHSAIAHNKGDKAARAARRPAACEAAPMRTKRSVWTVAAEPYAGAHFASFPRALIEPCILAGSRPGEVVLDPFLGSGTTAQVAEALGRQWIGCEIQPEYLPLIERRLQQRTLDL